MTEALPYPRTLTTLHYPDPLLRRPCTAVTEFDDALADCCQRMLAHMYQERGVGLAAPQVGISKRFFVTDHLVQDGEPGEPRVWINPRVEDGSGASVFEEGCLSVPGIYAKVTRYGSYDLVWQDVTGTEHRRCFHPGEGDFLGTVCQHELDHLDGILFVDHLSPVQLNLLRKRLKAMEKEYRKATGRAGAVLRR
ncbi:MAG: peptide deformylase [Planctomycetota bacterium]